MMVERSPRGSMIGTLASEAIRRCEERINQAVNIRGKCKEAGKETPPDTGITTSFKRKYGL